MASPGAAVPVSTPPDRPRRSIAEDVHEALVELFERRADEWPQFQERATQLVASHASVLKQLA